MIAPRVSRSIARLILVVLTLCFARSSIAEAPTLPRADQEPMTPAQPLPAQDPRQVAPGPLLFYDTRLSHNDNRKSPKGFSFA